MSSIEKVELKEIPVEGLREEPPEPTLEAVFRDGAGMLVEMEVQASTLREIPPVNRLIEERNTLQARLDTIPKRLQGVSRKRRHGGKMVPKSEREERARAISIARKELPNLIKDKEKQLERLMAQLQAHLLQSNPLSPLKVEVNGEVRIIEGKLLSEAEREWWKYLRKMGADGPWHHISEGEEERFLDVQEFFLARVEYAMARRQPDKERFALADAGLDQVIARLSRMTKEEYASIGLDIKGATNYIYENFQRRATI